MTRAHGEVFVLSESTDGRGIKIGSSSTNVHIHDGDTSHVDQLELYAVCSHTAPVKLTIEWGGTTDPDDLIEITVPHESGLIPVAGAILIGNGLTVSAKGATADVIVIFGKRIRIQNQ